MPESVFDNGILPYVYIVVAGWLVTDVWRWLGVLIGNRVDDNSSILLLVRSIATALVAAVVAQLILFPSGVLSTTPVLLRMGACATGFAAFLLTRQRMVIGIAVAEAVLIGGMIIMK